MKMEAFDQRYFYQNKRGRYFVVPITLAEVLRLSILGKISSSAEHFKNIIRRVVRKRQHEASPITKQSKSRTQL